MKITFEQLKQAMLDNGWEYSENTVPLTSLRTWDYVFTNGDKCWYSADKNIWFNSYSNKRY